MAGFAEEATKIGQGIGGFLNPIIGGTSTTTVTETPTQKKDYTMVIVVVVAVLLVGGFLIFGKKAQTI